MVSKGFLKVNVLEISCLQHTHKTLSSHRVLLRKARNQLKLKGLMTINISYQTKCYQMSFLKFEFIVTKFHAISF